MEENTNVLEVIEEIKSSNENELNKVIENWFTKTRADGMKIGAGYISATIYGVIRKHLNKKTKPSLRDHQRCIDEIIKIISIQITTQQNDSEEIKTPDIVEEVTNNE